MKNNLLPADTYTIINASILSELDKRTLINFYEPIIGPIAVSLYLTFWGDLDRLEIASLDFTHHHLMTILKCSLEEIEKARSGLESLGLIKSFIKKDENINEYVYMLYSPLSPYEFFNNPVLSVLLLNNIGKLEYDHLLSMYKQTTFNLDNYEEITKSMNETFKVSNNYEAFEEIRKESKLGIKIDNIIDFDLVMMKLPKGLVTPKTLNKRTKELINQLAFVYNVDSIKMADYISYTIDNVGLIDRKKLTEVIRRNYEYNNNGSLPTLVYRTQPEHLKTPVGDTSNRAKMIYVFENTKPYDFLKSKNHGIKPTLNDLKKLEHLAVDFKLPPGVINVLVDYVLRVNDGKLNFNYMETIASNWSRKKINTVDEAMMIAYKNHNKTRSNSTSNTIRKSNVPDWMNKDNKSETMSPDELKELEAMYEEFR